MLLNVFVNRLPIICFQVTLLIWKLRTMSTIHRIFGQVPGGIFGADENARLGYIDSRQGTET